jgi:predicted dehydrogenase
MKTSLSVTAGTLLIAGTKASGDFRGSNEAIRVAVCGINGRGTAHIGGFAGNEKQNSQVVYLVDPDTRLYPSRLKSVQNKQKNGPAPKTVADVRRALDDKDVDAVSVATPNHWHSLITIWACQAGKDVYVEKPMSHNVQEGQIAVATARKYNRIVQHGTQSRSSGGWDKVTAAIHSGQLGKLLVSRGLCYKPGEPGKETTRTDIGFREPTTPPPDFDFNLWLGPAPEQPYHTNIVHYRWHWFWDFGNGDIGNQGVHEMDKARWALPPELIAPKSAISFGGRFGQEDQAQVPNTQVAVFDYGPGNPQLVFEVRGFKSVDFMGEKVGNVFELEAGTIRGTKFFPKGSDKAAPLPKVETAERPGGGEHFNNFLAAMRSRKITDLNADILEGQRSCNLIHWANASYRVGERAPFNKPPTILTENKLAADGLARMEEHLKANGIKTEETAFVLGKQLQINAETEYTHNENANQILRGTYRKGFEVPEKV